MLRVMEEKLRSDPVNPSCQLMRFGRRAAHFLCDHAQETLKDCVFYYFGVNYDWSFDKHLAESWNCDGILLDPTIKHLSHLHPRLRFFPLGAKMLSVEEQGGAGALQSVINASG